MNDLSSFLKKRCQFLESLRPDFINMHILVKAL
nr:unnamed protein product [Callosobruchus analis]